MKDKLRKLLLIVPVVGFLFLVPLLTLISKIPGGPLTPTASYSVWENRTMVVFPQLTAKGFWDGSYFAGWETALSDQFYGRDYWLKAHTRYAMLRRSGLEPREKAFASAVFYGVLERQFTLDWMLAQCLRQPLAKLDAPVRAILRAGLYQAVYMDSYGVTCLLVYGE